MDVKGAAGLVERARNKAGLGADVVFYTLGHTCLTKLVNNGGNLRIVQDLAGHRQIKMTQRYTHVSTETKRNTVTLLGR